MVGLYNPDLTGVFIHVCTLRLKANYRARCCGGLQIGALPNSVGYCLFSGDLPV